MEIAAETDLPVPLTNSPIGLNTSCLIFQQSPLSLECKLVIKNYEVKKSNILLLNVRFFSRKTSKP